MQPVLLLPLRTEVDIQGPVSKDAPNCTRRLSPRCLINGKGDDDIQDEIQRGKETGSVVARSEILSQSGERQLGPIDGLRREHAGQGQFGTQHGIRAERRFLRISRIVRRTNKPT